MDCKKLVNDYEYVEKISEAQCASVEWQHSDLSMQGMFGQYLHESEILALPMAEKGISDVNQSFSIRKNLCSPTGAQTGSKWRQMPALETYPNWR